MRPPDIPGVPNTGTAAATGALINWRHFGILVTSEMVAIVCTLFTLVGHVVVVEGRHPIGDTPKCLGESLRTSY